jgi:hypothetical protein
MKTLVQRMREQRMIWVEFDSAHKVRVLPPTDLQVMESVGNDKRIIDLDNIATLVHEWKGFTEEDFLGKGVGSSDELPLDRDALNELLANNVDWAGKVVEAIQKELLKRTEKRQDSEKNSEAS